MGSEPTPYDDGELYDLILGDLDYGVEFYTDLAKGAGGPVLEVACGTGRIMLPCLRTGVDIEGLDSSAPMLDRLREKAAAEGFSPSRHHADMAGFRIPRRFALIMIPFNAFIHNLTADDQIACLSACRNHLKPGGLLTFDTYFPRHQIVVDTDNSRELEQEIVDKRTGLPMRIYDNRSFDRVRQLQHSLMEIEFLDGDGKVREVRRMETTVRFIYKMEMELLLRLAGFSRYEILGGFDGHPLERETDSMVVKAWR